MRSQTFESKAMTSSKGFIERRKHKRFNVKKGAFVVLSSDYNKMEQIKDICGGGLSFLYYGAGEKSNGSTEVGILSTVDDFYLKKLRVRIVSDLAQGNIDSSSSISMRQVGMRFEKLMPKQKFLLDYFMQYYTKGDRRSGFERRQFLYTAHPPKRRSDKNRRKSH